MMRTPSIKTLSAVFDDPAHAKRILRMPRAQLFETPAGAARDAACYNPPKTHDIRMTVLDSIEPGTYGVEYIAFVNGEYADYLNTGETYAPTLIRWRGRYRVQSMGDFIETMERSHLHTE
jgi:hypothetical protein